jgi:two-component system, OmpR family, sensor kinase
MRVPATLHRVPLRWRLALGFALMLVAIVAVIGLYLVSTLENNLLAEIDESLGLRAFHVERASRADDGGSLDRRLATVALSDLAPGEEFSEPGIYVQLLESGGAPIASSPNLPAGGLPGAAAVVSIAMAGREAYTTTPSGPDRIRTLARPVKNDGRLIGVVVVGESLHLVDVAIRRLQQLLSVVAIAGAMAALLGGWWLTARAFGPIAEVTRVARRIASTGHFEQRINTPRTQDELGELTETFNEMLERLERTFRRQKEFLADASHELRGPLMVIRGNLDLLKMELSKRDRRDSAREATEEVDRMSRLVSDLLFLAEADSQETVDRRPVELSLLLREILERAEGLDAGAHELLLDINEPTTITGDRDRLTQMIWNLVHNALRYTPEGGRISLSLRNNGRVAELVVADTGVGIAPEHLPRIFERFYRVDRARSRSQDSTGLGLAIVKQIAEAHGGQLRVRSRLGQGSDFTIALPILRQQSPQPIPQL